MLANEHVNFETTGICVGITQWGGKLLESPV